MRPIVENWQYIGGGSGLAIIYFAIHYLRSVNENLRNLIKPIEDLQKSIGELNIKIATIIADRENDKELIDELRRDVKEMQRSLRVN